MKANKNIYIIGCLQITLMILLLSISGCSQLSWIDARLNEAEALMESHPDSALSMLDSIYTDILDKNEQKARYALLRSMALDKNYIDKTSFEVLQPAIDYYLENGTPDEKLRTYYYQGRIYQNKNELDSALFAYTKGVDLAAECKDSVFIARSLRVQGSLFKGFYDYDAYIESNLRAAEIYHSKALSNLEFDCLTSAINGLNILKNKARADSVIRIIDQFEGLNESQKKALKDLKMTYIHQFGSIKDLKELISTDKDSAINNANTILNLARAYCRLEDYLKALELLHQLDEAMANYDTLKFLAIKHHVLEGLGRYQEALTAYKDFSHRTEVINSTKFEQKSRSMEEKHQLELQAEREARVHIKTIWELVGGIGVLLLVMAVVLFILRSHRIKRYLAEEKARNSELENEKLMTEKAFALEKARNAELENQKLKTEKENLTLANENLKLERDNKALEAENLAHRVEELEKEGEDLKELLESQKKMPEEVRKAVQKRIEMLNSYLASQISDHKELGKAYDDWVAKLTANTKDFMDSNRLAFQASHPAFISYFEDHRLTVDEINYVCLYAIGLRGKDVGHYMKMRSHVNISSTIRKKLGIDKHDTNIGIYVRKLLKTL